VKSVKSAVNTRVEEVFEQEAAEDAERDEM
jgi:hypothetical protein